MPVNERLVDAYRRTTYRVMSAEGPIDIRIDENNAGLDRLLQLNGVREWAFVTAGNPQSQVLADEENARRNEEMKRALREAGWTFLDGVGLPDQPGWKPEQSVLVLGMERTAALALAKQWGQLAIVCGSLEKPAQLVWTA